MKTESPEVFVYPEAKMLCLSLKDLALVLSWDACTEGFLVNGDHPEFTKINMPIRKGGSNGQ
jgi:hypothetical protein